MALYKCSVINQSGKKQKIIRGAESKPEIIDFLKQNKYIIIEIKETKDTPNSSVTLKGFSKIKSKDLSVFCKQLSAMIRAGVTIVMGLDILKQQTSNKKLSKIIGVMYEDLQKGNTFSEAASNHKDIFPEIFISMVEAGELSGNIDVIMDRLSLHFEKEYKIENKVKSAMTYPMVLLVLTIAVVVFMLTSVLPTFVGMFDSSGVELPAITQFMLDMSDGIKKWWYVIALVVVSLIIGISALNKNPITKIKIDMFKLKIPVYKNFELKVATSRFTRTLATLMGSGAPLLQSLDAVSGVTGNTYIGSKIIEAKEDVRRGLTLSQPLRKQNIFPPMVYNMIKIGEDSGSMEEILDKTADFYDEEVEAAVQTLTAMLEPIMIVVMAVVIGFIVIAMVSPMFDMMKTVQ